METPCLDQRLQAVPCGHCRVIYWAGGEGAAERLVGSQHQGVRDTGQPGMSCYFSRHLPSALLSYAFLGIISFGSPNQESDTSPKSGRGKVRLTRVQPFEVGRAGNPWDQAAERPQFSVMSVSRPSGPAWKRRRPSGWEPRWGASGRSLLGRLPEGQVGLGRRPWGLSSTQGLGCVPRPLSQHQRALPSPPAGFPSHRGQAASGRGPSARLGRGRAGMGGTSEGRLLKGSS